MLNRRKFLTITTAASAAAASGMAQAAPLHIERGIALGAHVTLRLAHPDAAEISRAAMAEIARLEEIFSLYRPASALVRLNRDAALALPPPELLACLSLVGAIHDASGGLFDPTVQPVWHAYARAATDGVTLSRSEQAAALAKVGWGRIKVSAEAIELHPGMALTLNGIAQGYICDRVAAFLAARGLDNVLIDTGEMRALGHNPTTQAPWRVRLAQGGSVALAGRALASSSALGMTFGNDGASAHILDPRVGLIKAGQHRPVSVSAPSAALADGLSTAACLMQTTAEREALIERFPGAALEGAG